MRKRIAAIIMVIGLWAGGAHAKVMAEVVNYTHDNVALQGYLVWDDQYQGRRPGILVVHEWWGLTDFVRKRAQYLASLGYMAFALDMYGTGKSTDHPQQASEWMNQVTQNISFWQKRALAGLAVLKKNPQVDPDRLAAIGYCFGGATVQQLAYSGADLRGVVSFHGSLIPPPQDGASRTKAKLLICHGAADPFTSAEQLQKYLAAIKASSLDWSMVLFGGAKHAFTNPDAGRFGMDALQYNLEADRRSWDYMKLFLGEVFGSSAK